MTIRNIDQSKMLLKKGMLQDKRGGGGYKPWTARQPATQGAGIPAISAVFIMLK